MRIWILAALASGALVAAPQAGKAEFVQGPYCLYYSDGSVDCSQPSREMCMFTTVYRPSIGRCYPNEKYRGPPPVTKQRARDKRKPRNY